jgi:Dyp-type peroxidase family
MAQLNHADIQGFVLTSYAGNMPCANYVLLKITQGETCRQWLKKIAGQITTGVERKTDFAMNIAFTAPAFAKLGFSQTDLSNFSIPFQEGMTSNSRQQILGDCDGNSPENWAWGYDENQVDILLLVFAKNEETLNQQLAAIDAEIKGVQKISSLYAGRQPDSKEHFGFLDGVGQPVIEGTGRETKQVDRTGHATVIKAGEFILGYENEMLKADLVPYTQQIKDFGKNGTYLVFRQLEQHVSKFWNFIDEATRNASGERVLSEQEKLGAKIVGRWKSGAPLTKYPNADPAAPSGTNEENNFNFTDNDKLGLGCPIGSHIRRTNPRDSLLDDPKASILTSKRHRIIRRGRSYGHRIENIYQDDNKERGLYFICINSNIERQFEFIQQNWVNNQAFGGLNHETDPLIGNRKDQDTFSIPGCPVRTRIHGLTDFITTKGGAYFFMPGITALHALSNTD